MLISAVLVALGAVAYTVSIIGDSPQAFWIASVGGVLAGVGIVRHRDRSR
jgi:hypothetical protein